MALDGPFLWLQSSEDETGLHIQDGARMWPTASAAGSGSSWWTVDGGPLTREPARGLSLWLGILIVWGWASRDSVSKVSVPGDKQERLPGHLQALPRADAGSVHCILLARAVLGPIPIQRSVREK